MVHAPIEDGPSKLDGENRIPWYSQLNSYHWWVLIVAALGWLFDTMDQRLFTLARQPALNDLLKTDFDADYPRILEARTKKEADDAAKNVSKPVDPNAAKLTPEQAKEKDFKAYVQLYGGYATMIFLFGWATGGLFFGMIGDRWGRVLTMLLTILIYSLFTGLSAFATGWLDFAFYRFLAGIGVGGEFAAGVALVAEVMPPDARPYCLGALQALSAVGNIMGSLAFYLLNRGVTVSQGVFGLAEDWTIAGWRIVFLVGILPALLIVAVRRNLDEPESWKNAKEDEERARREGTESKELGSISELLGNPTWAYRVAIGISLSVAGVVGLWGVGFWTPELLRNIVLQGVSDGEKNDWSALMTGLQDVGGFFGIGLFTILTAYMGRRPAFAFSFVAALATTCFVFGMMSKELTLFGVTLGYQAQIFLMGPLIGFFNLAVFGGYAIYFPELFPTRLRSTGTGFCYNVARFVAALGPLTLGLLADAYRSAGYTEPLRPAAITVASVYLVGLVMLLFAPETKDQPLPE